MGSNPTLNMRADLSDYAHMVAGDAAKILGAINLFACFFAILVENWRVNNDVAGLSV